jgi:hypothetical protein
VNSNQAATEVAVRNRSIFSSIEAAWGATGAMWLDVAKLDIFIASCKSSIGI